MEVYNPKNVITDDEILAFVVDMFKNNEALLVDVCKNKPKVFKRKKIVLKEDEFACLSNILVGILMSMKMSGTKDETFNKLFACYVRMMTK